MLEITPSPQMYLHITFISHFMYKKKMLFIPVSPTPLLDLHLQVSSTQLESSLLSLRAGACELLQNIPEISVNACEHSVQTL